MSHPQPKRPSSKELIEKHSVASYISYRGRDKPSNRSARLQVHSYK